MDFKNFIVVVISGLLVISCGGTSSKTELTSDQNSTTELKEEPKEVVSVSIWDKVSVRDAASEDGKWLTSLSLGETSTFLGKEETGDKGKVYLYLRLNDGTEGWSRSEFVIPNAKPGVFVNESDIYNRPDLLTKSNDKFGQMDIVAVKQSKDDWVEVIGKPSGEKWMKSGWVKSSNLTYNDVDIAMAKFAKPVLDSDDVNKTEKLNEILENQDFSSSIFVNVIQEALSTHSLESQTLNEEDTVSAEL